MTPPIAIVGLACRYPDAASPQELWENVLAQRRAFRQLPAERLNTADYFSSDPLAPDRTYSMTAALIEDYEFDRVRHRVSGASYRSADLAHWLALDIAGLALADAGFPNAEGLPRESTGVYLGNTLTGEFSRAAALRLRWPYVRRVLSAALRDHGVEQHAKLLRQIEDAYKRPFPDVDAETLAGSLSNTAAGRISNHFDLHGGGYTVDGACASSLLAVATACSALAAGDCDVALAGGVDLSLDPFELVGFAKAGALAAGEMRVFDTRSAGFWPGEGCGFAVLRRHDEALAAGQRIYAVIRGWGVSSDGSGGITRPEVEGQLLALKRAYRKAGFSPRTVAYFEGHGTGTAVGDATELRAIVKARAEAGAAAPAVVGSIKANIGHTKAAAGIAGLIKAGMALYTQVLPPATACDLPHPAMGNMLRVPPRPECWPTNQLLRASVSAMGFGGINCHVAMEGADAERRGTLSAREKLLGHSPQDAELFVFHSMAQVTHAAELAAGLSLSEMSDLAASLAACDGAAIPARIAVVASTPRELAQKLAGKALTAPRPAPRIGFLFPGQGSQHTTAATEIAQPAIVRESLEALRELTALGIEASVAIGHSLGELTALCWSGALAADAAIDLATARGRLMAALPGPPGTMASVRASEGETRRLIASGPGSDSVVVAGINAPRQTVVSGDSSAVLALMERARTAGFHAVRLPVSHAFHSPLVAPAAEPLSQYLASTALRAPARRVISSVTGAAIAPEDDLRQLLRRQIVEPVRFRSALLAAGDVDLWIEVGPGRVLSGLAAETVSAPVLAVESGQASRRPLLEAVAAAIEAGAPARAGALFENRFARPFRGRRKFFVNPCELAPADLEQAPQIPAHASDAAPLDANTALASDTAVPAIDVVRALVAERTELPPSSLTLDARLMADLHLNSIVVAQVAADAARRLGIAPSATPLDYAGLSLDELAHALEAARSCPLDAAPAVPAGIDSWVRTFRSRLVSRELPGPPPRIPGTASDWQFFGPHQGTLRAALEVRHTELPFGGGVVLCLPPRPDARVAGEILKAAQAAVVLRPPARFVLVQHGGGAASVARTVHLEARNLPVSVVDVPADLPGAADRALAEAAAVYRYTEAHFDQAGTRFEPVLALVAEQPGPFPLGPDDVLLVSGGGKGIGAECAIEAARLSGARLALIGSSAADHPEVAASLLRMRSLKLQTEYFCADVTDAAAVRAACESVRRTLGPITAILHCAGVNHPQAIEALDDHTLRKTIAVKTAGLDNLLAACAGGLRLVVAFGSIIARLGMAGEAGYALANEWLERDLEHWSRAHPECRCLTLEWSVWAGAGMGARVARMEYLNRLGVSAMSIEEGVRAFGDALRSARQGYTSAVVAARFGAPPTLQFDAPELPLLRFLERVLVHYPGVELICEAELSIANDPYLSDHVFSGSLLLPGVIAMEAMAQAAMALTGSSDPPAMSPVHFTRPVIVPSTGALTIRLLALERAPGEVEVCLRSAETAFQADHFRATCRFASAGKPEPARWPRTDGAGALAIDPAKDLYGGLLFHRGRFRRLSSYLRLHATECVAEARAEEPRDWFNRYLPQTLVLGDPGIRDSAIHAIQACIPHARVLPCGAASVEFGAPAAGPCRLHAFERSHEGDLLIYDLEIATAAGDVVERWRGLELRIVEGAEPPKPLDTAWPPALLAPYLERRLGEFVPQSGLTVTLCANATSNGIAYRPDGKPLAINGHVSRSHADWLTLTVGGARSLGCDCEPVTQRSPDVWRDLLGPDGFALAKLLAREAGEDPDCSCTRVWCAMESAKKAGGHRDAGIVLPKPVKSATNPAGWVILSAGSARVLTLVVPVAGFATPVAFAFMVEPSRLALAQGFTSRTGA